MKPPFNTDEYKSKLKNNLERIPGVVIPDERLKGRPSFEVGLLIDDTNFNLFSDSMKSYIEDIRDSELEPNK
jgi:hypothetical protein